MEQRIQNMAWIAPRVAFSGMGQARIENNLFIYLFMDPLLTNMCVCNASETMDPIRESIEPGSSYGRSSALSAALSTSYPRNG